MKKYYKTETGYCSYNKDNNQTALDVNIVSHDTADTIKITKLNSCEDIQIQDVLNALVKNGFIFESIIELDEENYIFNLLVSKEVDDEKNT